MLKSKRSSTPGSLNVNKKTVEREKVSLLIVESDVRKRQGVVKILRSLGYEITIEASNGAPAFNLLRRKQIDIIISAWDMPTMNGLALLQVVSSDENLYTIPFVILTPKIKKEMVVEAGKRGVAAILVEPVEALELGKKLNAILTGDDQDEEAVQIEMLFAKAKKLAEENKLSKALTVYKDILELQESPEVYYNIGHIQAAQGHLNEAIIAFRKAVMIDNFHARAYKEMGDVYIKNKEPQEAEKCFEKAGNIFLARNMDNEAEMAFTEAININSDTRNVYNSLGILYRKNKDYKKAIQSYESALKVDPKDENIHCNLGRALLESRQIIKAKKVLERAVTRNPNFEVAKRMLQEIEARF